MKVRNDFVTNSSSSSFIIAKSKNGCKFPEIKEAVEKQRERIKEAIKRNADWIYSGDNVEFNAFVEMGKFDEATDIAINLISYHLDNIVGEASMDLDGWHIMTKEYDSETSDVCCVVMYEMGTQFESENMRIG